MKNIIMEKKKINWEKALKEEYKEKFNKNPYNCFISHAPRCTGGTIHLLIAGGKNNRESIELYS